MKLIPLSILIVSLEVGVKAQKFRQDFPFPPQFQTPNVGMFTSDSSLYLPPESHTALPYFMKNLNMNNLQFPLLPPTGTKAPSTFPTPYPLIISSGIVPNFDDDDDDEDRGTLRVSTSSPPKPQPPRINQTEKAAEPMKEKREMRQIPNMMFQPHQHIPIQNRNDVKFPFKMPPTPSVTVTNPPPANPAPAIRRMIIGSETQRSDVDQVKAPSFIQGPQFLPAGQGIYVSSSTEPAIPILRLSNEMDLDGSFSYEALSADQTHYVQHSRMENMGTDKEEQVVEGSYSYVGDNGQTYTVHYVADANGFRASGDHLPVAPPVPEIIQRAVQYNLAEEAKKPPHLKSWQDDGRDNEVRESDKTQQFSSNPIQQFSLPPTRNLFTGRTPEAFSYSYSQGSNTGNNLVTAASNQAPIKTVDYTTELPKANNALISPQITFLASQGAHLPSMNTVQNQISRMFTTEKPLMPQIVNYEAHIKEADQEPNKGLWRWQYGINANTLNQNPNKETISRSFGEGDDIMINFSDMTPDQYTKMIRSQFEYSPENAANNQYSQNLESNDNQHNYLQTQNLENNNMQNNYQYTQNTPNTEKSHLKNSNQNQNNNQYNQNWQNQFSLNSNKNQDQNLNNYNDGNQIKENQENQNHHAANNYQPQETNSANEPQNTNFNEYSVTSDSQLSPSTVSALPQSEVWNKLSTSTNQFYEVQSTAQPIESRKLMSDTSKILTQKNFMFPVTQTVTQSYDFDENIFYEPRKIKALNTVENSKPVGNTVNEVHNIFDKSVSSDSPWNKELFEVKEFTTQEPYISTIRDIKFTDFIVQRNENNFKPISTTTTEAPRQETTTENFVEDIIQNNIFLKNLFSPMHIEKQENNYSKTENYQKENKLIEEPKNVVHTKVGAEPKTDKIHKIVQYQPKPVNDIKVHKKKPLDLADILNYVSMKNHFESSKVKSKGRIVNNNFDQRNEMRFIPIQQEREENGVSMSEQKNNNLRTIDTDHREELRGLIKNYKVLQRNNNNMKYDNSNLKTELSPPPLKFPSLPPLGRAGPSMKSYLPPIYV